MSKTVYLVYVDGDDYHGGLRPNAVFDTKQDALAYCGRMEAKEEPCGDCGHNDHWYVTELPYHFPCDPRTRFIHKVEQYQEDLERAKEHISAKLDEYAKTLEKNQ